MCSFKIPLSFNIISFKVSFIQKVQSFTSFLSDFEKCCTLSNVDSVMQAANGALTG